MATCLCWSCLVEAHRQQPRYVGNCAIVRSGASQLLLEFASAGAVELSAAPSRDLWVWASLPYARLVYVVAAVHVACT